MTRVYPDYYPRFRCIGGDCRHNCCIGWEIDIDEETLALYDGLDGELGDRLRRGISRTPEPHFVLGEGERCPFLNEHNLCDIITALGEEALCDICAMHPRFCNETEERLELGLGLCCEAAARLILQNPNPVSLVGGDEGLRAAAIAAMQDRRLPIGQRLEQVLAVCGVAVADVAVERLLALERLDEAWTARLQSLSRPVDRAAFDGYMAKRQTEYEQFAVYLLYRHFPTMGVAAGAFAVWATRLLMALGAAQYAEMGVFTADDQGELARLFSSEIEYSEENLETVVEAICR